MQVTGKHKLYIFSLHFSCLVFADARLQCQKMLERDTLGFVADLSPTILAGGFCGQHGQGIFRKCHVVIMGNAGKNEIRLEPTFRNTAACIGNVVLPEYLFHMVFQRQPGT